MKTMMVTFGSFRCKGGVSLTHHIFLVAVMMMCLTTVVVGYYDLYSTLEINRGADERQIKKAFRTLSKKWHPDTPSGDRNKFQKIQEAYNVLNDPEKRRYYDQTGVPPEEGGQNRGGGSGFGFHGGFQGRRPPPKAEPIKSAAKTLTVEILRAIRASGLQQVSIVQLYQNHYYECLTYAKVWESLIKGKMRHVVQFYRVDTWNDEAITNELNLGSHGVPSLIALVGSGDKQKIHSFSPSGEAMTNGRELQGVKEAQQWIETFLVDTIALGTTLLATHNKPSSIYKWANGLSTREMGILVYPSVPEDAQFLPALVTRTRSREVSIVRVDSRDAVLQFLYSHCPKIARNELGKAAESREFVIVFNRSDLCESSIIKTSRSLKVDRVMPFLEYHRAVPPLTAGRCGPYSGQDELCFIWVLPSGYTLNVGMVEPEWVVALKEHLGPFAFYHVSEDDEPQFVRQFDLTEPGSGRRSRLNDLIFVAYLGMEPQNYGIIRVAQDSNIEDRMEQKIPGTLQQFLHGQKMSQGRKGTTDVMNSLLQPVFPLSLANSIWYSIPDVPLVKSLGSLVLVYILMQFFTPQANNHNNNQQQQQQQRGGQHQHSQPQQRASQPQTRSQDQRQTPQSQPPRSTTQHSEHQRQQQDHYRQPQQQQPRPAAPRSQPQQQPKKRASSPPASRRPVTPPRPPPPTSATSSSQGLKCRGIPFLGRADLSANEGFDGFVILVFIPEPYQLDQDRPLEIPIPLNSMNHAKIRLRAVGTTQDAVWNWMKKQAEARNIEVPLDKVTLVATRPKRGKAVIRSANSIQSGADWMADLFQGGVSLDINFSLSGKS